MSQVFLVLFEHDGDLEAVKVVYPHEFVAAEMAKLQSTIKKGRAWVMAVDDPRAANDAEAKS